MRIVHIITRLIVGGAQENTLLSCEGQHLRGHDVTLITGPPLGPEGSLMDQAAAAGYRVEVLDEMRRSILPGKDFRTTSALTRRLKEMKPDVVHTHSSKAGILGRWAAHRAGVPAIIHTIHGLAFTASTHAMVNGFYKFCERRVAPLTDRIVCVADAMRAQSLAQNIGTPEQYITIYSGMKTEPFLQAQTQRGQVRKELGFEANHLVVGTIARLFDLKGHDDLLAIAPELCRSLPQLRFLWVGDGLLRGRFEQHMRDIGLRHRFVLTGLVPPAQVPRLTGAMDILVHPSRREGLARALPQAALTGIPAITYNIDGAKEGVLNEQTGFVLQPFDTVKLAQAITVLATDSDRRKLMGQRGRDFAMKRFDANVMVAALNALYEEVNQISGKSNRRMM